MSDMGDFMGHTTKNKTKKMAATKQKRKYTRRAETTGTTKKRKYTRRAKRTSDTITLTMPKDPRQAFKLGFLTAQYAQ